MVKPKRDEGGWMRAQELQKMLERRPLEPFRLHISSGQFVDVTHPEAAIVTKPLVAVGIGGPGVHEAVVHHNLLHVVKIEPLNGIRGTRGKRAEP